MIPKDKLYHAAVGAAVGLLSPFSLGWSAVLCLVLAIGKEVIWDWRLNKGTPEFLDVFATVAGWALVAVLLTPFHAKAAEFHLGYAAKINVPKHDAILGKYIERYNVSLTPKIDAKYFHYELEAAAHGGVRWIADVSGSPLQWDESDWSPNAWRYTLTHRAHVGPKAFGLETEFYLPLDRHNWGGHGRETEYYWQVGVGGEL